MELYENTLGKNKWQKDLISKNLIIDIPYSGNSDIGYELMNEGWSRNDMKDIKSVRIEIDEESEHFEEFNLISDIIDEYFYTYSKSNGDDNSGGFYDYGFNPSEFDCGDGTITQEDYDNYEMDCEMNDSIPSVSYHRINYYSKNYVLVSNYTNGFNYKNYLGNYFFKEFIKCDKIGFIDGSNFIISYGLLDKEKKYNFIDKSGKKIFNKDFDNIEHINYLGYLSCKVNNKFNLLDSELDLVFKENYDYLGAYFDVTSKIHKFEVRENSYEYIYEKELLDNMYLILKKGDKWNILDKNFKFLFEDDVDLIFRNFNYKILGENDRDNILNDKILIKDKIYSYNIVENIIIDYEYKEKLITKLDETNYIINENGKLIKVPEIYIFNNAEWWEDNTIVLKNGINILDLDKNEKIDIDIIDTLNLTR